MKEKETTVKSNQIYNDFIDMIIEAEKSDKNLWEDLEILRKRYEKERTKLFKKHREEFNKKYLATFVGKVLDVDRLFSCLSQPTVSSLCGICEHGYSGTKMIMYTEGTSPSMERPTPFPVIKCDKGLEPWNCKSFRYCSKNLYAGKGSGFVDTKDIISKMEKM